MFFPRRLNLIYKVKTIYTFFCDHDTIAISYLLGNDYIFVLLRSRLEEGLCNVKLVEKMQHLLNSTSGNLIMRSSLRHPCAWYDFLNPCLELLHPLY